MEPTHCDVCGCEKKAEDLSYVHRHPELVQAHGEDEPFGYVCFECN